MSQKDCSLSLGGDAFASLRSDFDQVLRTTIAGMIDTDQSQAEVNVKVKITLSEGSAPDYTVAGGQQTREVTKPKFEHTVTAVIQRREKKTGTFSGEYELVWDQKAGRYFIRDIEDGQQTLFDEEDKKTDEEPEHVDIVEDDGPLGLPEPAESVEEPEGEDTPGEADDSVPDAAGEFEEEESGPDPAHDPSKPFGWLRQFIGETMTVCCAHGDYTVRTSQNRILLSSATSRENPFYCPAEKLAGHVDHHLVCVGYGDDEIVNISIECEDCNEVVFDMNAPGCETDDEENFGDQAEEDDFDGPEDDEGLDDFEEDDQDFDYGEPEE